jgi:hypothetical protein
VIGGHIVNFQKVRLGNPENDPVGVDFFKYTLARARHQSSTYYVTFRRLSRLLSRFPWELSGSLLYMVYLDCTEEVSDRYRLVVFRRPEQLSVQSGMQGIYEQ